MNLNRNNFFIVTSSIALLIVLIIQVNWILRTADIKEEIFNEKANMVLSKTTEAIETDPQACQEIGGSIERDSTPDNAVKLGANEVHKIDSLFNYYMKFYNFHIDYTFEIAKPNPFDENNIANYTYNKPLENVFANNKVELKLIFPEKKQYILAEMGSLFITSVVLILIVLILFWKTVLSLIKEKKISEHTTDFLNNMTHEFKTPLTNIALAGKMIIKDPAGEPSEKIKHYTGIIIEENEKLRFQVEQVLSMTALERGEIPLQKTQFDFHQLITESLKQNSVQIENRKGNISFEPHAIHTSVVGDRMHLANSFCNLIDNAIKYSKDQPAIIVKTFNRDNLFGVSINDNGIGIEKEYLKKVFDKFFRVPTGDLHDVKGFGLGLAYVKKIVELHGGSIEIESEKGKGTKITFTVPHV